MSIYSLGSPIGKLRFREYRRDNSFLGNFATFGLPYLTAFMVILAADMARIDKTKNPQTFHATENGR